MIERQMFLCCDSVNVCDDGRGENRAGSHLDLFANETANRG